MTIHKSKGLEWDVVFVQMKEREAESLDRSTASSTEPTEKEI